MRKAAAMFLLGLAILIGNITIAQTLKCGTDEWPPYQNLHNKEKPGFCTEVLKHVFNSMGIEATYTQYPWKRAVIRAYDGNMDVLYCAYFNEERADKCYYPDEHIVSGDSVLFIRSEDVGRLTFNSLEDLKGKQIGLLRGAHYFEEFLDYVNKHAHVQEVSKNIQNINKLNAERVDYIAENSVFGLIEIKKLGFEGNIVPLLNKTIERKKMYAIFSKKTTDPDFVKNFSEALKALKQTDTYKALYEKYFEGLIWDK